MSKYTTVKDAVILNTIYDEKDFDVNTQDVRKAISHRVADANDTGIAQGFAVAVVYFIGLWIIKRIARFAYNAVEEVDSAELTHISDKAYEMYPKEEKVDEDHIS